MVQHIAAALYCKPGFDGFPACLHARVSSPEHRSPLVPHTAASLDTCCADRVGGRISWEKSKWFDGLGVTCAVERGAVRPVRPVRRWGSRHSRMAPPRAAPPYHPAPSGRRRARVSVSPIAAVAPVGAGLGPAARPQPTPVSRSQGNIFSTPPTLLFVTSPLSRGTPPPPPPRLASGRRAVAPLLLPLTPDPPL